jgi:putative radical SAM enzyme (TIGR03279 family)
MGAPLRKKPSFKQGNGRSGLRALEVRGIRRCRNRCPFCFVSGLPPGLRQSLYVKDDDYVQSFLFGSFVTLTNLSGRDWTALQRRRPSPLFVSVHATEQGLRRRMLGNPQAPDIMEQLRRLGEMGIVVHAQVVLCPGVNDGAHLDRTVADLAALYPTVESVAVVPMGVSRYLEAKLKTASGPWPITPCDPSYSLALIQWAAAWQEDFRRELGQGFLHLADEFYLVAGQPLPPAACYDGFPQYHNGVGLTRSLLEGWPRAEGRLRKRAEKGATPRARRLIVLCGVLIAPVIRELAERLVEVCGVPTRVVAVENRFFGPRVTVSGLLTGGDLLSALPSLKEGDVVLVPRRALEASGRLFLDGMTLQQFRRRVGAPVTMAEEGRDLERALWGTAAGAREEGKRCVA